jgi:hypothetical protein
MVDLDCGALQTKKMNIAKFCGYRFLSWEIFDLKKGV